jgi:hypothetical protein
VHEYKKDCVDFMVQEISETNKVNRGSVQLHQKTGSRSYIAHRYSLVILLHTLWVLLGCMLNILLWLIFMPGVGLDPFVNMQCKLRCVLQSNPRLLHAAEV